MSITYRCDGFTEEGENVGDATVVITEKQVEVLMKKYYYFSMNKRPEVEQRSVSVPMLGRSDLDLPGE